MLSIGVGRNRWKRQCSFPHPPYPVIWELWQYKRHCIPTRSVIEGVDLFSKAKTRSLATIWNHIAHLLREKKLLARLFFKTFHIYLHKTKQYKMNHQISKYDTLIYLPMKFLSSTWMTSNHGPYLLYFFQHEVRHVVNTHWMKMIHSFV